MPSPGASDFLSVTGTETAPGCRMRTPGGGPGWPSQVPLSCGLKASSQQQSLTPPTPGPSPARPDSQAVAPSSPEAEATLFLTCGPSGSSTGTALQRAQGPETWIIPISVPWLPPSSPSGGLHGLQGAGVPEALAGELPGGTSILTPLRLLSSEGRPDPDAIWLLLNATFLPTYLCQVSRCLRPGPGHSRH